MNELKPVTTTADMSPDNTLPDVKVTGERETAPLQNPLNAYESYTYSLSLHLLGQQEYNNIVNSQGTGYVPSNVLVSSAGRFGATFNRNSEFAEDFYFDNFKMETTINVTTRSRSSNLIECSFTLIEPLGFTFINRLMAAAAQLDPQASYLAMPYLIQIDFFGYQDGETQPAPSFGINDTMGSNTYPDVGQELTNLRKSIPVQLIGMKTRVTSRGTEYTINAVPYNHQAFNQINITTPAAVKVQAKTVQQIFGTGDPAAAKGFSNSVNQRRDLLIEQQRLTSVAGDQNSIVAQSGGINSINNQLNAINNKLAALTYISVSGITDAINDWWVNLKDMKTVAYINKYYVKFHPDIGNSQLYTYGPINSAQASVNTSTKNSTQAAQGASKGQIDFNSGTISIAGGVKLDALIDWAVRNSEYIASQLKKDVTPDKINPATNNGDLLTGPLKWYKIIPKIHINQFDPLTNRYSLDITLEVNPWLVSQKLAYAPLGRKPGEVKLYEWMYSGQNKDVLDMQIDFDMLYYNQLRAYQDKSKVSQTAPTVDASVNANLDPTDQPTEPGYPGIYKGITKVPNTFISDSYQYTERSGGDPYLSVKAGDLQKSLSKTSRGDMINLNLKIIGDPHFIKQDDFFYNFNSATTTSSLTPNGSLWMDGSELYIRVIFRSPIDYDDETGLAIPNLSSNKYSYSEFSGVYQLIKVTNEFRQGKFEQMLELVLITIEEGISNASAGSNNVIGPERINSLLQLQVRGFTSTRFTGPSILQTGLYAAGSAAASQIAGGQGGAGGAGGVGGIVSGLVNQVVGQVTNKVTGAITDKATAVAKQYGEQLLDKAKAFLGVGQGTNTLGGTGGADGAASSSSGNIPDQSGPAQSAMNQESSEWTTSPGPEQPPSDLVQAEGVDGSVGSWDPGSTAQDFGTADVLGGDVVADGGFDGFDV